MKIAHINTIDRSGGAALTAARLHESLIRLGIDSRMLVRESREGWVNGTREVFQPSKSLSRRAERFFRRVRIAVERNMFASRQRSGFLTNPRTSFGGQPLTAMRGVDLVNLHWVAHFLDIPSVFSQLAVPIVWTLHDMNPFTGGCHCTLDCREFESMCGQCPYLGADKTHDLSRHYWRVKRAAYKRRQASSFVAVAPSRWIQTEANSSSLFRDIDVRVIHNGVDVRTFSPIDKQAARTALGVPKNAFVLLFSGNSAEDEPWKGSVRVARVLRGLKDADWLYPISIGPQGLELDIHPNYHHLGVITDERLLAVAYSSADLVAVLSRQESFSNMAFEAMACATPLLATRVGAIPEVVRDGEDGFLVKGDDDVGICELVRTVSKAATRCERMGKMARDKVIHSYSLDHQAAGYTALYAELLGL